MLKSWALHDAVIFFFLIRSHAGVIRRDIAGWGEPYASLLAEKDERRAARMLGCWWIGTFAEGMLLLVL